MLTACTKILTSSKPHLRNKPQQAKQENISFTESMRIAIIVFNIKCVIPYAYSGSSITNHFNIKDRTTDRVLTLDDNHDASCG
jgi:hypothetical protein